MPEENKSNFTEQINPDSSEKTEEKKKESPFLHAKETESKEAPNKPKKKTSIWVVLAALFIVLLLLIVLMVFVLAMGGPNNPILKTFGIDPYFLKESLQLITNVAFGAVTFILFFLLIIGVFRGLMAKKDEIDKKKTSFILAAFSFGMSFLTIMVWLGVFNFISKFVVNAAEPPAAEITINPSQKEISQMQAPIELTLSARQAKTSWERKGKKITEFLWDLDNDNNFEFATQELEFLREFNISGETTLRLLLKFEDGEQDIIEKIINLPSAVFDFYPKKGSAPLSVTFDAGNINNPKDPIIKYEWDFDGDNVFDEMRDTSKVEYTYKKIGTYDINLRTSSKNNIINKYKAQVEVLGGEYAVENIEAKIEVSPSSEGMVPFEVRFSAEDSISPNGKIVSYEWDFGDSSFTEKGRTIDHTFVKTGQFEVVLTVTDETDEKAKISEKIVVSSPKTAPEAIIKTYPEILEGESPFTVKFDASNSKDKDNNIVDYEWDYNNDGIVDSRGQNLTHVFRDIGDSKIVLLVRDSDKQEAKTFVNVKVVERELEAIIEANPESGSAPLTVDFDASSSTYSQGKIISYEWDFGDGTPVQLTGAKKSHQYTKVGQYEVKLKVFTDDDKTIEASKTIYVRIVSTQACFTSSRHEGKAPLAVSFDSVCSKGNPITWKWDFGDSSISNERKPSHVFEKAGTYEVKLELVDATSNVSKYTDVIEVMSNDE